MQTKYITDTETETASYKVLPLWNNVFCMDLYSMIPATPSNPCDPLAFYFWRTWNA
jgi:hypothetical protein